MINLPSGLNDNWAWFAAVWAWDYGDGRPLAKLVESSNGKIPDQFTKAIAEIIKGDRPRNLKAAVKSLIPPSEYGAVAGFALLAEELRDDVLKNAISPSSDKLGAKGIAESKGLKPIDVIKKQQRIARETMQKIADMFDVDVETIERLRREGKRRIKKWPAV